MVPSTRSGGMVMDEMDDDHEVTANQKLTNLAYRLQMDGLISAEIRLGDHPRFLAQGQCPQCGQTFDINVPTVIAAVDHMKLGTKSRLSAPHALGYGRRTVICRREINGAVTGCGACFSVFAKLFKG